MSNLLILLLKNSIMASVSMLLLIAAQDTVLKRHRMITKLLWLVCLVFSVFPIRIISIRLDFGKAVREFNMVSGQTAGQAPGIFAYWFPYMIFVIWMAGMLYLAVREIRRYKAIDKMLESAVLYRDNIYICDGCNVAFTYGFFRQKIILSSDVGGQAREYIIAHERQHEKTRDNFFKLLYMIAKIFNWYNPLMWRGEKHFSHFIELLCDERVTKGYSRQQIYEYAKSLVEMAVEQPVSSFMISGFFTEGGIRERITALIDENPKQQSEILCALTALLLGASLCVGIKFEPPEAADVMAQDSYSEQVLTDTEMNDAKVWHDSDGNWVRYSIDRYGRDFVLYSE